MLFVINKEQFPIRVRQRLQCFSAWNLYCSFLVSVPVIFPRCQWYICLETKFTMTLLKKHLDVGNKKKHPHRNIVIYCFTFESFRFRTVQRIHKGFKAFTFFDKKKKTINQSLTRAIFSIHPSVSYERKNSKKTEKPIKRQQNKFILAGRFSGHHCRCVLIGIITKRFPGLFTSCRRGS